MSDHRTPVAIIVFLVLMAMTPAGKGIAETTVSAWPMFGHDPQHTGRSEYVEKGWSVVPLYRNGRGAHDEYFLSASSPVLDSDGTSYAGGGVTSDPYSGSGFKAAHPSNEKQDDVQWLYTSDFRFHSSPAISSDGTVYVGSDDSYIYAFNAHPPDPPPTEAQIKWRYKTGGMVRSSPVIASSGTIYIGSDDTYLYAFDSTGTLLWKYKTGGMVRSSPAVGHDGTIYAGSDDGYLCALDPNPATADGKLKWRFKTGEPNGFNNGGDKYFGRSSPAIGSDGTIYIGSDDHYLYAVSSNGTLRWKYQTDGMVRSTPAIGLDGTIYFGSDDDYLYALDAAKGNFNWRYNGGERLRHAPAISADGTILLISNGLTAINPDGTYKWNFGLGSNQASSSPVISADGTVIVNGHLYLQGFRRAPGGIAIYGTAKDMATNKGIEVRIAISPYPDSSTRKSDPYNSGYYEWSLTELENPGPFTLTVSGNGYQGISIPNVAVTPGDVTRLDFLVPTTGTLAITRDSLKPAFARQQGFKDRVWVAGGAYPYTFSSTGLPDWCALNPDLNPENGTVTCSQVTATPGAYTFKVKVTDSNSASVEQDCTIYVMPSDFRADIDNDGNLSVGDLILGLKVLSRTNLSIHTPESGQVSLQGVIYTLQSLAGLRNVE